MEQSCHKSILVERTKSSHNTLSPVRKRTSLNNVTHIGRFNDLQCPSFAYPFMNFEPSDADYSQQTGKNANKTKSGVKTHWGYISQSIIGDCTGGLPIKSMMRKRKQMEQGMDTMMNHFGQGKQIRNRRVMFASDENLVNKAAEDEYERKYRYENSKSPPSGNKHRRKKTKNVLFVSQYHSRQSKKSPNTRLSKNRGLSKKSASNDSLSNSSINNISISVNNIPTFDENQNINQKTNRSSAKSLSNKSLVEHPQPYSMPNSPDNKIKAFSLKRKVSLRKQGSKFRQPSLSTIRSPVQKQSSRDTMDESAWNQPDQKKSAFKITRFRSQSSDFNQSSTNNKQSQSYLNPSGFQKIDQPPQGGKQSDIKDFYNQRLQYYLKNNFSSIQRPLSSKTKILEKIRAHPIQISEPQITQVPTSSTPQQLFNSFLQSTITSSLSKSQSRLKATKTSDKRRTFKDPVSLEAQSILREFLHDRSQIYPSASKLSSSRPQSHLSHKSTTHSSVAHHKKRLSVESPLLIDFTPLIIF